MLLPLGQLFIGRRLNVLLAIGELSIVIAHGFRSGEAPKLPVLFAERFARRRRAVCPGVKRPSQAQSACVIVRRRQVLIRPKAEHLACHRRAACQGAKRP